MALIPPAAWVCDRLYPSRTELTKFVLKVCVSSIAAICRLSRWASSTLPKKASGLVAGELSKLYVPNSLSLSEMFWSARIVKKFSFTTCTGAKLYTAVSPFPTTDPLGRGSRARNFVTLLSTQMFAAGSSNEVLAGQGLGGVPPAAMIPFLAFVDSTLVGVVVPKDWRIDS